MRFVLFSSDKGDLPANLALTNNFAATANPTVNNDVTQGYSPGSVWVNPTTTPDSAFMCTDSTKGAAVWVAISEGSAPGVVVAPSGSNASVTGGVASTATGAGGSSSVVGGAGGSTSGTGGAANVTGGAGSAGNANGGDVNLAGGAANGSGVAGVVRENGIVLRQQGAPDVETNAVTLTAAALLTGIIQGTPTSAQNYTLPLQSAMDTALPSSGAGDSFDFSIINLAGGAYTITVVANSWTTVGSLAVAQNVSGRFRARKTGTGAWTLYRLS